MNEMKVLSKNVCIAIIFSNIYIYKLQLTFCDYMVMSEKLIYKKDPNDPEKLV